MAEMWYYTTEGKQQDPVTMTELHRLVGEGVLKPTDMVWKDGMARWIRASSLKELFPDPNSALDRYFSSPAAASSAAPAASPVQPAAPAAAVKPTMAAADAESRPTKRRPAGDLEESERGTGRRPPPRKTGGSSLSIVIFLVLGAVLLLGALGGGVVILIVASQPGAEDFKIKVEGNTLTYKVSLNAGGFDDKHRFKFQRGTQYQVTVRTEPRFPDVDLHIIDPTGREVASDINPGPDSFVHFTPAVEGTYRVELRNLDPQSKATSTVRITPPPTEVKNELPPKEEIKEEPLPAGVREKSGIDTNLTVPLGKQVEHKFRVRAGHKASFKFVPVKTTLKTDFNLVVIKESDGQQIAEDNGPAASAEVSFTLPRTEIVIVRITNASKGPGGNPRGALSWDVSP